MQIPSFIKEHPIAIGAGVIGLIVIFVVLRSGSSGASAGTGATTDTSAVAAGTALQQAQYAGQVAVAQGNQQLEGLTIAAKRDVDLANINLSGSEYIANLQSHSADLASTLNTQVALGQLTNQLQIAGINADLEKTKAYVGQNQNAMYLQTIQALATGKFTTQGVPGL